MSVRREWWLRVVLACSIPIAVSAAWIPVRDRLPTTDLALALVLVIAAIGWLAGPRASLASAACAAAAFDLLDTRPYGALTMSRPTDVTTAVFLLLTGLLVGAGAARLARYRSADDRRADALAVVMEASGLVATGEEQPLITEALAAELLRALGLAACEFHAAPPTGTRPSVARDGSLVGLYTPDGGETAPQVDLPIWSQGNVVAHYRLTIGTSRPSQADLRVAVGLADQAGAALVAADQHPQPPPHQPARLRLLR